MNIKQLRSCVDCEVEIQQSCNLYLAIKLFKLNSSELTLSY